MKRYLLLGMMILASLLLVSCSFLGNPYPATDLTQENWSRWISNSPNAWAQGADRWFFTGDPNMAEVADHHASYEAAISTMMVRVPDFSNIKVNGNFEVQIFGAYDHNSVYVYGPNNQVRQVDVQVRGNTLYLEQAKEAKSRLGRVVVRVGVMNLNNLTQLGSGVIEARQLRSNQLFVSSSGCGNIYLSGDVNLRRVDARGGGSVSVFGACTNSLDIYTCGTGSVNISGNIGLKSIKHYGRGDINIIGNNTTNPVTIYATGKGKIGINGNSDIRQIVAEEYTHVYVRQVTSRNLRVYASSRASVGVAGYSADLYVNNCGSSSFQGRFLCSESAFVRANDSSHINVTAKNRMYAASIGNSSVYFFGSPNVLSQFIGGKGTVIPIWGGVANGCSVCAPHAADAPYSYKGENMYAHRKHWKARGGYRGEG